MDTAVDKNTPYNRRLWIFTALSLRFNEALTYREIAEQLNISSSAIHKMFTRFRRTGHCRRNTPLNVWRKNFMPSILRQIFL
nr:sigma-70 region 4 domain-containing protein [Enterobacter kobei]